jgi:hypothetical protein
MLEILSLIVYHMLLFYSYLKNTKAYDFINIEKVHPAPEHLRNEKNSLF